MARNHSSQELNFFFKVLRRLKRKNSYGEYETNNNSSEERKEGSQDCRVLELSAAAALKAPDLTKERNTALHIALSNVFRFPEELCIDFEENFELSESHYGLKSAGRKKFR